MEGFLKYGVAVIAVIALIAGYMSYNRPISVKVLPDGTVVQQTVGSAGQEQPGPTFSVAGVNRAYYSSGLNNATTTVCTFKSPSSTSTLEQFSLRITTGTTTALILYAAKATTPYATTTLLGSGVALASNAQVTFNASTTQVAQSDDIRVIAPNTYVNMSYQGPAGILNVLRGSCNATMVIN